MFPFLGSGIGLILGLGWCLVVFIAIWQWWAGAQGVTLVLTSFRMDATPGAVTPLEITGRVSGVVGWLLNLAKAVAPVELRLTQHDATLRWASLSGVSQQYAPLANVTSTECGYRRSFVAFLVTLLFGLGTVMVLVSGGGPNSDLFMLNLVPAAIACAIYYFSKRVHITLNVPASPRMSLSFKPSVVERVNIDVPEAIRAVELVNSLVLANRANGFAIAARPAAA